MCAQVGHGDDLPDELGEDFQQNETLLKKIHNALFQVSCLLSYYILDCC